MCRTRVVIAKKAGSQADRYRTAYRTAFPGGHVSHLGADELPNTSDPEAHRQAERAWVPYVPYDPSLEMPDEGRTTGRLTGILIHPQASNRASPARSLLSTNVRALTGLKQSATHPHGRTHRSSTCSLYEEQSAIWLFPFVARGPRVWARFRRDSAGDSLEVVHNQRPPNAVLRSDSAIQASYITTNDSQGVRALLRCIALNC
jgi:hypothetical protein